MKPRRLFLPIAALLAGCGGQSDVGPVTVSVIGGTPALVDASRKTLGEPDRVLAGATAQGLVRFDASGQVEPGIAERWIVIGDGTSYIFRLREARWPDGKTLLAPEVATALKRQLKAGSRNPVAPFLGAIDDVVAMTPQVLEIDLSGPRPDLLKLLAQPEMAIQRARPAGGTGPFQPRGPASATPLLRPIAGAADGDDKPVHQPEDDVRLIGERAARAIVRFANDRADLVEGGRFTDWPLLGSLGVTAPQVRIDPTAGLFGLAIVNREGFLQTPQNRDALAGIFDRQAMVSAFSPDWTPSAQILPEMLDSTAPPLAPAWVATTLDQRRAAARTQVAAWHADHPEPLTLRVALPDGPGATLLWGYIGSSLMEVGIVPQRVAMDAGADLRLVDAVAPYDRARWYLATACAPCGADAQAAVDAARTASSLPARAQAIAAADAAVAADSPFIVLARPLRWSLVSPRLQAWQANARAWHPLNHLRADTK